jgi:hypothetical protein
VSTETVINVPLKHSYFFVEIRRSWHQIQRVMALATQTQTTDNKLVKYLDARSNVRQSMPIIEDGVLLADVTL